MYIASRRGNKLLVLNSFTYTFQKAFYSGRGERWRCSSHQSKGCKAHVYVNYDVISSLNGVHTHYPPNLQLLSEGRGFESPVMKFEGKSIDIPVIKSECQSLDSPVIKSEDLNYIAS